MERKIDIFKNIANKNIQYLKCPKCNETVRVEENSLTCENNHSYDISKKGYINIIGHRNEDIYDKNLFSERLDISSKGFFDKLINEIICIIEKNSEENRNIIDIGCGCGYHLGEINKVINSPFPCGIDISKSGIHMASSNFRDIFWLVSNLRNMPFIDNSFDIILNILTPIDFSEFKRILKESGIIIKVIPGKNYLREIREHFFKGSEKAEYDNSEVIENIKKSVNIIENINLEYKVDLDKEYLNKILNMTPLLSKISPLEKEEFFTGEVTVHFNILLIRY